MPIAGDISLQPGGSNGVGEEEAGALDGTRVNVGIGDEKGAECEGAECGWLAATAKRLWRTVNLLELGMENELVAAVAPLW